VLIKECEKYLKMYNENEKKLETIEK